MQTVDPLHQRIVVGITDGADRRADVLIGQRVGEPHRRVVSGIRVMDQPVTVDWMISACTLPHCQAQRDSAGHRVLCGDRSAESRRASCRRRAGAGGRDVEAVDGQEVEDEEGSGGVQET